MGYGHVGSQVSILAESLGMKVVFFDVIPKLPMGLSAPCSTLDELLATSDFVTLHVPGSEETFNMIGREQIAMMKPGSFLLNLSRGNVVDVDALAEALRSGHLGGAAADVYPEEPTANGPQQFQSPLQGCPNTILTPHIGGATEEAQRLIGEQTAATLIRFVNQGSSNGAVNLPEVDIPVSPVKEHHRITNVHNNEPGVLRDINNILADYNVSAQVLGTKGKIGYLMVELDQTVSHEVKDAISALKPSIKTRIMY